MALGAPASLLLPPALLGEGGADDRLSVVCNFLSQNKYSKAVISHAWSQP